MTQASAQEQYLLELVNRFRLDPAAEYNRLVNSNDPDVNSAIDFFDVDLDVLASQWATLSQAQPLAWSDQLHDSATAHSFKMLDFDQQAHFLPGELGYLARMNNAGPDNYNSVGENIFAFTKSPFHAHAAYLIDWGNTPTGIQDPPGHRLNLSNNTFREAGFSLLPTDDPSTSVGPLVSTQHLANRDTGANEWLLGVAFRDEDDNDFYSVGEGLGGITVNISSAGFSTSVQTAVAGGYQTLVPAGSYTVSFVENGTPLDTFTNVVVSSESVKQDLLLEVGTPPTSGLGKIVGSQFEDSNGNGIQEVGEQAISGRTLFLDNNSNKQFDSGEPTAITDADGLYVFNNLAPGDYSVAPVLPAGREQTTPTASNPLGTESYQLDDGSSEGWISYSQNDTLIFNAFETIPGQAALTSISVGLSSRGNPTSLFIYQDADNDDLPDDNEQVASVINLSLTGTSGFVNVAIPETVVSDTFFVGALYEGTGNTSNWIPRDTTAPANQSWLAVSGNPTDFSAFAVPTVNWLLRANAAGLATRPVTLVADQTVSDIDFGDRPQLNLITGTPNVDTLIGTPNDDRFFALGNNDIVIGGNGLDEINGGDGNDILEGRNGDDVLRGGKGDDTLLGLANNDTLYGDTGADSLDGGNGDDQLNGGDGNDTLNGGGGNDTLTGDLGDDFLNGSGGNDALFGNDGNDTLEGRDGNDRLRGGNGTDVLYGLRGDDTLFGGSGSDTLDGGADSDSLFGGLDNDTLIGSTGDDILSGEEGDDILRGGNEDDLLFGYDGDDTLEGGNDNDTLNGGAGSDNLQGRNGNDLLNGDSGNDILFGLKNDDTLNGGEDDDILDGGAGIDLLFGNAGNDTLNGGSGNDSLNGGADADTLIGADGDDTLNGDDGDDILEGRNGLDTLDGGAGNDNLRGFADNDVLVGGLGNDTLDGGGQSDRLIGGVLGSNGSTAQIDTLVGGSGNDQYVVETMYRGFGDSDYALIQGFNRNDDVIELGSGSYSLVNTTGSLPNGAGIFNNTELVAIVQGYTENTLNLSASYFVIS